MELKYLSDAALTLGLANHVSSERKSTQLVRQHILEFQKRRLYANKYGSMMTYLMKEFGYCENSAYRRIRAAELLNAVPEIAEKLESGILNLTQVTKVQKCLKMEAQKGHMLGIHETKVILEKISQKNGFKTDQILAQEFNQPIQTYESLKPQSDESVQTQIPFTKEEFADLELLKSLISHSCSDGKLAAVIMHAVRKELKAILGKGTGSKKEIKKSEQDQSEASFKISSAREIREQNLKSQNFANMAQQLTSQAGDRTQFQTSRKTISVRVKRDLLMTANYSCDHQTANGGKCGSSYQLQMDHRTPVAWGGSDQKDNLRILCRAHNLMVAGQMRLL